MYKEAAQSRHWPILLAVMALAMTLPVCWMLELSQSEAECAVAARQIVSDHRWFTVTDGLPPLPVWILAFVGRFVPLTEATVRLCLYLPMLGTAAAVAWVGYRIGGRGGSAVAAATVLTGFATLRQMSQGSGDTWFCLAINGAWLTWFYFVRESKNWFRAWMLSLVLVGIAIMAGGPKALIFFYLPLCFMRRPLTVWRRLVQVEHVASLLLVALLSTGLIFTVPGMTENFHAFVVWSPFVSSFTQWYPIRLVLFPIVVAIGLLPWAFLLWPGYCAAFKPLERYPVLGLYLRTIMLTLVALYWVLPGGRPGSLLPLIGPAGLLVAMHYDLLVRRHGRTLQLLPRILGIGAVVMVIVGLLGGVFAWSGVVQVTGERSILIGSGVCLFLALVLAFLALGGRQRWPVWQVTGLAAGAIHLAVSGVVAPYRLANYDKHRDLGRTLVATLPAGATINLASDDQRLSPADLYYLDRPLHWAMKTDDADMLDLVGGAEVYVLKHSSIPVNPFREWQSVASYDLDGLRYRIWRGVPRPPAPPRSATDHLPPPALPLPTLP